MPPKPRGSRKSIKTRSRSLRRTDVSKRANASDTTPRRLMGLRTQTPQVQAQTQKAASPSDVVAIPVNTLNRSRCLKQGNVSMVLGRGTFGQVFDFCDAKQRQSPEEQSCKYVLKLQTLQGVNPGKCYSPTDRYIQEVFFHSYVQAESRVLVTPKLLDHWVCTDMSISDPKSIGIGCLLMERWDGSLDKRVLTMEELPMFLAHAETWTRELVRLKINHGDVFRRNILFRGAGSKIEFALSDWGLATVESDQVKLEQIYDMAFGLSMTMSPKEKEHKRTEPLINLL